MKIGVIGNTNLTFKTILLLMVQRHTIEYVFGLSKEKMNKKVNSCDKIELFCAANEIQYIVSDDWEDILDIDVDLVLEMGDSRIVPSKFLQKNKVIGNHGAILPYVQGAASLTWGRMLNNGKWGVSLFELNEKIDNGDILVTKEVNYSPENTSMKDFVSLCDDMTVECVKEYLSGSFSRVKNEKWNVKLNKHIDSSVGVDILYDSLEKNLNIYMPPRNKNDSKLLVHWENDFKKRFKIANNDPYPLWYEEK